MEWQETFPWCCWKLTGWGMSRQVLQLNQDHTVGDIRTYVASLAPGQAFELKQPPATPITADDSTSIKDAGLLNATIVQMLR
eukprot:m.44443 g.44443  ORF g.44443 m.44443 type:complete len:82 (-) comp6193_c0_seq4:1194-1439(-)